MPPLRRHGKTFVRGNPARPFLDICRDARPPGRVQQAGVLGIAYFQPEFRSMLTDDDKQHPWIAPGRDVPWIIGHRGHAEKYPENTLIAFRAAIEAGADMVELDYRPTGDGVLVCSHDDETERQIDLRRSPRAKGRRISTAPAAEIAGWFCRTPPALSGSAVSVPTLEAAIAEILNGGAVPVLERKAGSPERIRKLLRRLGALDRVCVQAFDWDFLRALRAAEPEIPLAALGRGAFSFRRLPELERMNVNIINWDYFGLTGIDVERIHSGGWPAWTWTVNRELEFHHTLIMGIDGVTTDAPDRLRRFLTPKTGGAENTAH